MTKSNELSFETALKRLEEIVRAMESGETDLDTMISSFEEGQQLVKACTKKLDEVEKRIEKLVKKPDGTIQPALFEEK